MNDQDFRNVLLLNLKRDEGLRLKPYLDTVGKLTIGYGRNLDDVGITKEEAELMLENDILKHSAELESEFPWVAALPSQAKLGVYNMAFNLGIPRLKGFKRMLWALETHDFEEAAKQALDSKWATQVGARADRIAERFRKAAME